MASTRFVCEFMRAGCECLARKIHNTHSECRRLSQDFQFDCNFVVSKHIDERSSKCFAAFRHFFSFENRQLQSKIIYFSFHFLSSRLRSSVHHIRGRGTKRLISSSLWLLKFVTSSTILCRYDENEQKSKIWLAEEKYLLMRRARKTRDISAN